MVASTLQIIKVHPGSSICDKKVPAIIYDDLVSTFNVDLDFADLYSIDVYQSDIRTRGIFYTQELLCIARSV